MLYDAYGRRLYLGEYDAFVVHVNDPERRGRIRCRIPEILGDVISDWAAPVWSGTAWVAPIGALVVIRFKAGDPSKPEWFGQRPSAGNGVRGDSQFPASDLFTGHNTSRHRAVASKKNDFGLSEPTSAYAARYPHNRVCETPGGIVIETDDTPGKQRVHVYHPSGTYIEVRPDGAVVMKVKNDSTTIIEGGMNLQCVGPSKIHGLSVLDIEAPIITINGRVVLPITSPI
jgi:hypothetical protein